MTALLLFSGFALRRFLGPGLPIFFDAHSHLARSWMVAQALRAAAFPGWSNAWYAGYPSLEFYGPLYYWVTGGLTLAAGDVVVATKLLVWAGQVAMAIGFGWLLLRLGQSAGMALLGGVLLVKGPLSQWVIGTIGNYPTLVLLVVLPVAAAHFVRHARPGGSLRRLVAGQAVLIAVMGAGHLTNTVAQLPALLAFCLAWLWVEGDRSSLRGRLGAMLAALLASAALLSFAIVPMALDAGHASLSLLRSDPPLPHLHLAPLLTLAGLRPYDQGYPFVYRHGVAWLALATAATALAATRHGRGLRPLVAGLAAALVSIPLLGDRPAIAAELFLVALCCGAVDALARAAAGRRAWGGPALWGAALAAALAWPGAVVDNPVPRYQPVDALDVYTRLPDSPTRSRTFDLTRTSISTDGFYGWSSFSPALSGRAIPFGGFPQGSSLDTNVFMALAGVWFSEREHPGTATPLALDAYYLAHVGFLVERRDPTLFARSAFGPGDGTRLAPDLYRLAYASPAVFSERVSPLPARLAGGAPSLLALLRRRWREQPSGRERVRDSTLRPVTRTGRTRDWTLLAPVVEAMGLDRRHATARQLFAAGEPPPPAPGGAAPQGDGDSAPDAFAVLEHRESLQRARIVAHAPRSGWLRVCYSAEPGLRVRLDGERVPIAADALGDAFLVAFPAGTHTLEVRPPAPRLRVALTALCGIAAAALAVLAARGPTHRVRGDG